MKIVRRNRIYFNFSWYSPGRLWGILFVFITTVSFFSCEANNNRANILPPEVQYMADTMFSHRRRFIQEKMDSLCAIESQMLIQKARDSIVTREQKLIKNIIGEK